MSLLNALSGTVPTTSSCLRGVRGFEHSAGEEGHSVVLLFVGFVRVVEGVSAGWLV